MVGFINKIKGFIAISLHSRTIIIFIILALLAAVSLTVIVAQQQQQISQRAEGIDLSKVEKTKRCPKESPFLCRKSNGCYAAEAEAIKACNTQPDLIPNKITYEPKIIKDGDTVNFKSTISNIGNGHVHQPGISVQWLVDGKMLGDGSISVVIPAGETIDDNNNLTWKATAGKHKIEFIVDPNLNYNYEEKKYNNATTLNINVLANEGGSCFNNQDCTTGLICNAKFPLRGVCIATSNNITSLLTTSAPPSIAPSTSIPTPTDTPTPVLTNRPTEKLPTLSPTPTPTVAPTAKLTQSAAQTTAITTLATVTPVPTTIPCIPLPNIQQYLNGTTTLSKFNDDVKKYLTSNNKC